MDPHEVAKVRFPFLHTAGVAGSNPAPPTKEINDLRHPRVAFAFGVLEKCQKAGCRASGIALPVGGWATRCRRLCWTSRSVRPRSTDKLRELLQAAPGVPGTVGWPDQTPRAGPAQSAKGHGAPDEDFFHSGRDVAPCGNLAMPQLCALLRPRRRLGCSRPDRSLGGIPPRRRSRCLRSRTPRTNFCATGPAGGP
jgi:hypothetical protein